MNRASRGSSVRPSGVTEPFRNLVALGCQVGGLVFILVAGYLIWGLATNSITNSFSLPLQDKLRVIRNIIYAAKILGASGIIFLIAAAIRFYDEETVGYLLLIFGGILYWGIPSTFAGKIQLLPKSMAYLPMYVLGQFKLVGIAAILLSVVFIIGDLYLRLSGVRRFVEQKASERRTGSALAAEEVKPGRLYLACWQTPYCRPHIRKYCNAYEKRKTCWRIKSGCYCDEEMVIRILRQNQKAVKGFDIKFSETATRRQNLTPAQKRERCRNCFLYAEHQKQKYKILSPLVFPAVFLLMFYYLQPIKSFLHKAIVFTEHFAEIASFGARHGQPGSQPPWANLPSTANAVEWLLIFCIYLVIVTYLLRFLEYCIFKWQI
ncbi:MAG: hypothetical protein K6T99_07555 [Armatimonadetes bacterium]|nr:hypothetical protein [Armatimonadota bacterium]